MLANKELLIMKDPKGYTLIEVLLVVVLFGIVATAVFPNLKQFYGRAVFDSTVQRLLKTVEYARARAVMENTFLRLSCNTAEQTYELQIQSRPDQGREEFIPLGGKFGRRYHLPENVHFMTGTTEEVFFNPDGSIGKYTIGLEQENGRKVTLHGKGYFGTPVVHEENM